MFSFEYPFVFALLPFAVFCLFFCKVKKMAIYFPQTLLLKNMVTVRNFFLKLLKILILILTIIALSSPIKTEKISINNAKGYEISIILDASGSMKRNNKFKIVKKIVSDFIKKRKTDKLALSIFADFAYVVVPFTYDKNSIQKLLKNIKVGIAGENKTALYEALFLSSKLYKDSKSKEKIAILLTDGIDNAKSVPLDVAIRTAKKYKIKVYTIGIGNRSNFNLTILKKIAHKTGGKYFTARNAKDIKGIYNQINSLEKSKIKINQYLQKSYYFQYPLILALLLLVVYFWRKNT